MLTSYSVVCPHPNCGWRGSLLPRGDQESWRFMPVQSEVVFQCPSCEGEWRARVVGDDVVPLPMEELAAH
jgi:hypothetical protein